MPSVSSEPYICTSGHDSFPLAQAFRLPRLRLHRVVARLWRTDASQAGPRRHSLEVLPVERLLEAHRDFDMMPVVASSPGAAVEDVGLNAR